MIHGVCFAPIAGVYSLISSIRNRLYDAHMFYQFKPDIPTICVGNLAVGGTGKTPHVEWLIRFLSPRYKVAVLSRGYKRQTKGFVLASASSTAQEIGDESQQIHEKFPDVVVAVCERRTLGIRLIREQYPDVQVIILDDAFQHRQVRCGFNILLTTADNLYVHDHFLPWGQLRDNTFSSLRANAVIVTKCPETMMPIDRRTIIHELNLPAYQQLAFSFIQYAPWQESLQQLPASANILVVAGIAHPEYLFRHVQERFPNAVLKTYMDHYDFTLQDIQWLEQEARRVDAIVTTEKDFTRIQLHTISEVLRSKIFIQSIEVRFVDDEPLKTNINRYLSKHI